MQPPVFRPAIPAYRMPEALSMPTFPQGGTAPSWPATVQQQTFSPGTFPMGSSMAGAANSWNNLNATPWQPDLGVMNALGNAPGNGFGFPSGLPRYPLGFQPNWNMQPANQAFARPAAPYQSYDPPRPAPYNTQLPDMQGSPSYPPTRMPSPSQNAPAWEPPEASRYEGPPVEQQSRPISGGQPDGTAVPEEKAYIQKSQASPPSPQPQRMEPSRKPEEATPVSPASITKNAAPDDPAAKISDEIRELVYEGLTDNPELLDELQQMGISEKLQNREKTAHQLRSTVQEVLRLVPDRLEDRVAQAVSNRIPLEYQPLFDRFMNWTREPAAPGETPDKPKTLLRRVWDWFWGRKDKHRSEFGSEHRGLHLPFTRKKHDVVLESEMDPFEITA
jgi:hypothetical protein